VLKPQKHPISADTKALIDRLLLERISLAGIARAAKVSERGLQSYVNEKYKNVPRKVIVSGKTKGRLTIECDELWSFVGQKGNKHWIWLAIDRDTREIVGVFVGDRSRVRSK
jgi:insertion element IS1 protein InsB